MRVECPACATSYTLERLGLVAPDLGKVQKITVICMVCKTHFDARLETVAEDVTVETPGWMARTLLRRKPVVESRSALNIQTAVR